MRYLTAVFCGGLVLTASACASRDQALTPLSQMANLPGQVEPVYAAAIARDQAIFWVTSNGCTEKSDLWPVVTTEDKGAVITLRRVNDDRCRSPQPNGLEVRWSFEELGLAPGTRLSVRNPAQVSTPAA